MDTITFKTPVDKHEVVLKEWLTGREKRSLQKIVQAGMRFSMKGRGGDMKVESEKLAEVFERAEDRTIETVVVSVNGKKENVLDGVLDMKSEDYDFVIKKINSITKGKNFTRPGKSQ